MSRWEFMRKLEELLSDISPNEREEALQYYNDYFNDAGRENEQEVIAALGSPEQVAEIVKDGLGDNSIQGEFTENGFSRGGASVENELIRRENGGNGAKADRRETQSGFYTEANDAGAGDAGQRGADAAGSRKSWAESSADGTKPQAENNVSNRKSQAESNTDDRKNHAESADDRNAESGKGSAWSGAYKEVLSWKKEMPFWEIALIVIGCIFLLPVILPLLGSVAAAVLSVIAVVIAVAFGMGVAALVLIIVAIALIIAGFGCIFAHPALGIGLLGGGCICGALGMLFMIAEIFIAGKCLPAFCRWIGSMYKKISEKIGGKRA